MRLVIRRNLEWKQDSLPLRAYVDGAIVAEPGLRTVEQCISSLLRESEGCEGDSDTRPIRRRGQLVGYIEITQEIRHRFVQQDGDASDQAVPRTVSLPRLSTARDTS